MVVLRLGSIGRGLRLNNTRNKLLLGVILFLVVSGALVTKYLWPVTQTPPTIKSGSISASDISEVPETINMEAQQLSTVLTSPALKANFEYNALAPHWKEVLPEGTTRDFKVRSSDDGRTWSDWITIGTEGAVREDEPHPDMTFIESPLFVTGKFFQYEVVLKRADLATPSPEVKDITVSYIDSRTPKSVEIAQQIGSFLGSSNIFRNKASAAQQMPNIVSRAQWGSPDPYGEAFKHTNSYWNPSHVPVRQVFIHHTVNQNQNTDPSAIVRGIWHFHTYTRGWGDIGYNYLVDQHGTVYEGRAGGENVVGGHTLDYNRGSMAVALIGCYGSTDSTCKSLNGSSNSQGPTAAMWSSLTTLLSWKTTNYGIDPRASQTFCKYDGSGCLALPTIAGHRDANLTSCPGDLVYNNLHNVRWETHYKNATQGWAYSAKQASYHTLDLSAQEVRNITLSLQNNGATTWDNSKNRLLLKTASPPDQGSAFSYPSWHNPNTPTQLAEVTIAPGQTGNFNFNLRRPADAYGEYLAYFKVHVEGVGDLKQHYAVPIRIYCTFGSAANPRPGGFMLRDPATGAIYLIENETKRPITSMLAGRSNRLFLEDAPNVSIIELNNLPNGAPVSIGEGVLVQVPSTAGIYITDVDNGTVYKRLITSMNVLHQLDIADAPVYPIDSATLANLPDGPAVSESSNIPDGLLVQSPGIGTIYLTKDGSKHGVQSPAVLFSHGYDWGSVRIIAQNKVDQLNTGAVLDKLRLGTLVQESGGHGLFVIGENGTKRWVSSLKSLHYSGLNLRRLVSTPSAHLATYVSGDNVECHQ